MEWEYLAIIVVLAAGLLFFASGGSVGVSSPVVNVPCVLGFGSCTPVANSTNSTVSPTPLPFNSSCFGFPLFTGGGLNRSGQDCTGNGEFTDDVFCLSYPPANATGYANNLTLYCVLGGEAKGQCCA